MRGRKKGGQEVGFPRLRLQAAISHYPLSHKDSQPPCVCMCGGCDTALQLIVHLVAFINSLKSPRTVLGFCSSPMKVWLSCSLFYLPNLPTITEKPR